MFMHLGVGVALALAVFIALYPPLYHEGAKNFIGQMLVYYLTVGADKLEGWNLYAPSYIAYTTPAIILFFFMH